MNKIQNPSTKVDLNDYFIHIFKFLIVKRVYFIALILIGGAIGFLYANFKKPIYNGTISFVLSTGGKTGGIGGLASQFGLDLGTSGGEDLFSGDNIISLFESNKMLIKCLFKEEPIFHTLLINRIIQEEELDKKWRSNKRFDGLYPFKKDSLLNPIQDSLIREVCQIIQKNELNVTRPDKKLSGYLVSTTSTDELFSCYLTKFLVDETTKFYIETKTSLAKQNLIMLQKEADSIKTLLGYSIASTASEVDKTFNLNPALQIKRSSIQRGQVNTTVLGTTYGEVTKNLELAKINLQKEIPLYQIIDVPSLPLKAVRVSKLYSTIYGILAAFLAGIIFFLIRIPRVI